MEEILSKCSVAAGKDAENALEKSLTSTRANQKQHFVILVLDEIDQLMKDKDGTKAMNAAEKLLKELNKWSSNSACRFALICIGNAMNNAKQRRLLQFLNVSVSPTCAFVHLLMGSFLTFSLPF
jgi:Cdc6-like AAA superfamily ATPase